MTERMYLDFNATTPIAAEVAAVMQSLIATHYGNPSSLHWAGVPARDVVEAARCQVAALLQCDATEIVFTSGGTEANNFALKGVFFRERQRHAAPHFIVSQIEHPAILEPCRFLERLGAEVTQVPVDGHGCIDPDDVRRAIRSSTVLVSIMHANNEVGTLQPIDDVSKIAHEHGVLCHTDAAQSVGKVAVDVESLGVDLLSVAGHKLYAPKGVGALFVREGIELEPLLHGAGHEAGRRAGTENVLQIAALGAACELASRRPCESEMRRLRNDFWQQLQGRFGASVVLNGRLDGSLPNTLNVSFVGRNGGEILARMPEIAASTGSACHAGEAHVSPVLAAMGVPADVGLGAIRFSLGRTTTQQDIDSVIERLTHVLAR